MVCVSQRSKVEVYSTTKSKLSKHKCKNRLEIYNDGITNFVEQCPACRHCRYILHLNAFQRRLNFDLPKSNSTERCLCAYGASKFSIRVRNE